MLPVHSQGRPEHRRSSYSQTTGAFTSLGALPRRKSASSIPQHYGPTTTTTKKPTFHFSDEDDSESTDELVMPLRLSTTTTTHSFTAVPFPRSSPLQSPSVARTPLGKKPFKSSLKSSTSSPNIPFPSQSLVPSIMFPDLHQRQQQQQQQQQQHQRASSAPCTPLFASSFSKNVHVHFPSLEEGGLATVRVFNSSARPASLSRLGEETETETDSEGSTAGGWSGKYVGGSTSFPFPPQGRKSPLNPSKQKYEINWSASSGIPRRDVNRAIENVFLETLDVVQGADDETVLEGTLLVRNTTYQKTVMVRYTLDEWETMNDVWGCYAVAETNGWDRFKFSVSLDQGLENRVMWFVAKYAGQGQGNGGGECVEWWDNNGGRNYRVVFRKAEEKVYKRGVTVSAPTTPTRPKLSSPQISSSPSFPFSAQQERERSQHQAAITQTTLARLKKLNLKNYAAPSGYTYNNGQTTTTTKPPPELKFNHPTPNATPSFVDPSSPTTSTDSTPLQTPTLDDEEDDKLTWSLCLENGQFATMLMPSSPSPNTTPIASPIPLSIPPTYPSEMGTSPPFSDLGGGGRGSVYWDWGSRSRSGELSSSSAPQRKRECESASSSSSGSGNDSNPLAPPVPTTTSTTTNTTTSPPPPPKQKPTPPKLNLPPPSTTFSSPTASSPSHVQSPNLRRSQRHRRYFHHQPPSDHSPPGGGGGDSDAVYEALVREWCFAQGPAAAASGEMTPKVQVGGGGGNLMQSVEG